jgi:hypothetical protein
MDKREKTVAFVGCGSSKRLGKQPAYAKYDSWYFAWKFVAASHLGIPVVASAKHGYHPIYESTEDYDETLRGKTDEEIREWGRDVIEDLPDHVENVVMFAGSDYVDGIKHSLDTDRPEVMWYDPFANTEGNGEQMAVAKEITERIRNGETKFEALERAAP